MPNLHHLATIPTIKNIEQVKLDTVISDIPDDVTKNRARENSKELWAYKIVYTSQKHKVVGYIVEPKKGKNLPCIVYNRSGSKEFGAIREHKLFLGSMAKLARAGYIVIASQYSGNGGSEGQDAFGGDDIYDVLNLYTILKKYPRADVSRIGMYGASRGGMMTYMALPRASWIRAAVVECGITDLLDIDTFRPDFQKHLKSMFGGSIKEKKKRSVMYWVDTLPKNVPLLIMHGTADWRVNPLDSLRLAEKLQQHKLPYKLIMYEGADHSFTEHRKEVTDEMLKWFDVYVKNKKPL